MPRRLVAQAARCVICKQHGQCGCLSGDKPASPAKSICRTRLRVRTSWSISPNRLRRHSVLTMITGHRHRVILSDVVRKSQHGGFLCHGGPDASHMSAPSSAGYLCLCVPCKRVRRSGGGCWGVHRTALTCASDVVWAGASLTLLPW